MPNNLDLWNSVRTPDPKHTKSFSRKGGFKGTAVNSSYTFQRLTEKFGPCGIGWGYDITEEKLVPGAIPDVIHVVYVELWYKLDEVTGRIPGVGQTTFVGTDKNGEFTDEEAPKKSLTDAITNAASKLGFNADVYLGLWDDNKYVAQVSADAKIAEHDELLKALEAAATKGIDELQKVFNDMHSPTKKEVWKEHGDRLKKIAEKVM